MVTVSVTPPLDGQIESHLGLTIQCMFLVVMHVIGKGDFCQKIMLLQYEFERKGRTVE